MKLVTKIYLSYGLLLALAVSGAGLALLTAYRAGFESQRVILTNRVHQRYLALSNHTYQLFKQFADAILIGDRDGGQGERALLALIKEDFNVIRYKIGQEIDLFGEEEIEEYFRLAEIERLLTRLTAQHDSIHDLKRQGASIDALASRLIQMHDEIIDKEFNELIHAAIEEEAREVSEVEVAAARRIRFFVVLTIVFLISAVLSSAVAVGMLVRDIRRPLQHLLRGAEALTDGHLDHRIGSSGPAELAELARAFNAMAEEMAYREAKIAGQNQELERVVAGRTAELEHALGVLKANQATRRQLLADISHELRTPLTIIRGEADVALRGKPKPPEVYREALERMRSATEHSARIVDDMLFIARQEANEVKCRLEDIDLRRFLLNIVDDSAHLATGRAKVMFEDMLKGCQGVVRADPVRIRQVMLILLDNAIHYGAEAITVGLEQITSGYLVTVTDDGSGMTEQDRERAFERFFRGSDAAQRYDRGTGLGLPVAKAIVEAHGGEITLRGAPGQGITAVFTVPTRPTLRSVS